MKMDPNIFREYDIRGVFNEQFDLKFAYELGKAYAGLFEKPISSESYVTLGFDARNSSPGIAEALIQGLNDAGLSTRLMGLVTSPMTYFTTFTDPQVIGSFMVTGSHNPPEYNGFKISVGKSTIFGEEIQKLKGLIEDQAVQAQKPTGENQSIDYSSPYVKRYLEEFGQLTDPGIVLDCGNGSAGAIVNDLYSALGLKPKILFEKPDGQFPNHHPDPTVEENLIDLKAEVIRSGARVGIGFDGDADRIGIVDETGRVLMGDEFIALMSRFVLEKNPGAKIIGDVKCSDEMYRYVEKLGGTPIMWKTGHSLIKEKIKVEDSPFGGELSGHIFFRDRNYGFDDALYAGLRLIEVLGQTGKTIRELLNDLPPTLSTPEIRIETTEKMKFEYVDKVKKAFLDRGEVKVNEIDGVRVSYPQGWALARVSNTQPVIVFRFEAQSFEALKKISSEFEGITNLSFDSYLPRSS